jgi:membrane protease YdiL (CAAX protease family)
MKILKLLISFIVFLFIYSFISLLLDTIFNNAYTSESYTIRRIIQLGLFILYIFYITKTSGIKLNYSVKPVNILIYLVVLFAFIFLYENTIDFFINLFLTPSSASQTRETSLNELFAYPVPFFIQACISAPLFEEILVRGILYEILHEKMSSFWSVVICSMFFSIMHYDSYNTLFYIMVSIILSYIFIKTGSISYCIILHMFINAFSFLTYYVSYSPSNFLTNSITFGSAVIVIFTVIVLLKSKRLDLKKNNGYK